MPSRGCRSFAPPSAHDLTRAAPPQQPRGLRLISRPTWRTEAERGLMICLRCEPGSRPRPSEPLPRSHLRKVGDAACPPQAESPPAAASASGRVDQTCDDRAFLLLSKAARLVPPSCSQNATSPPASSFPCCPGCSWAEESPWEPCSLGCSSVPAPRETVQDCRKWPPGPGSRPVLSSQDSAGKAATLLTRSRVGTDSVARGTQAGSAGQASD